MAELHLAAPDERQGEVGEGREVTRGAKAPLLRYDRVDSPLEEDEQAVYDYCTELFQNHAISDETYERAKALFGVPRIVELTALIGYYGMVAMTLLAHQMPLPSGVKPPLAKRR